jgi:REP element-mobilizing transposase RayT
MHARLYHHIVWTTCGRVPSIDAATARFLSQYLPAVANRFDVDILEMGMVSTHIHLLVRIHTTTAIARLVQGFKGGSATRINREIRGNRNEKLRWAHGYSAKSVGEVSLDRIRQYVRRQAEHHPDERIRGWPE